MIKHLDSKNVSKYQKESQAYKKTLPNQKDLSTPAKLLPLFALYHNLLNFILPLCSTLERPHPEIPVTTTCNIVDITGVGLTQFWNLKQHMQDGSVLATAHYPETLDRIFVGTLQLELQSLLIYCLDNWRTCVLPDCLGLDQAVVRSCYGLQNFHSGQARCQADFNEIHGSQILAQEIRRGSRLGVWRLTTH